MNLEGLKPEEPDAYTWLQRIRKNGNIFSGGLWNQPFLFMLEVRSAEIGESQHLQRVMANKKLEALRNAK